MEVPDLLPLEIRKREPFHFGTTSGPPASRTRPVTPSNATRLGTSEGFRHLLEPAIPRQTEAPVPKRQEIRVVVAPRSAILLDAELHEAQHHTWMSPDFRVLRQSVESILLRRPVVSPTRQPDADSV